MCIRVHIWKVVRIDNWSDNFLDNVVATFGRVNWLHKGEFVLTKCGMA